MSSILTVFEYANCDHSGSLAPAPMSLPPIEKLPAFLTAVTVLTTFVCKFTFGCGGGVLFSGVFLLWVLVPNAFVKLHAPFYFFEDADGIGVLDRVSTTNSLRVSPMPCSTSVSWSMTRVLGLSTLVAWSASPILSVFALMMMFLSTSVIEILLPRLHRCIH